MKNQTLKIIICVITACCILISIYSCSILAKQDQSEKKEGKPLVGFSMCSLLVEGWYKDRAAITEELSRLDVDVIVQNANNDPKLQAEQIDDLIDKGVNVLIITPVVRDGLSEQLERAHREGIKIIAYARLIEGSHIDAYYCFDSFNVGRNLALGILDGMDSGNLLIINGARDDHNTTLYREGYMSILEPGINSGRIKIIDDIYCPDWEIEYAYEAVEKAIGSGKRIDGILAANDALAGAAIQVLLENGIADDTVVVGQDGELAAYQRIVEGVQHATVYKPYNKLGSSAAVAAYRMCLDLPFAYTETIDNGYENVKFYNVDVMLVTDDNIDEVVIDSGVYTQKQVYMNVIGGSDNT